MPESRSAFNGRYDIGRHPPDAMPGLSLCEIVAWDLVQAAAWRGRFEGMCERVAAALGTSPSLRPNRYLSADDIELLTVAPLRLWCLAPIDDPRLAALTRAIDPEIGCITPLGHSHSRVRLHGTAARRLLAQEIAIDLDPQGFPAGAIARTALHHVPVVLQCIDADAAAGMYDLYLPRTFAASTWEYLLDLAVACGCEILPRVRHDAGS